MNSYLWYDCETTGLSEYKHDIIQIACVPVIDGVKQKEFNEYCQPTNWNDIQQEALNVHGITIEQMKTFQTQEEMLNKLIKYLHSFNTMFVTAGFNVFFDKKFLYATFKKFNKNLDFYKLFTFDVHDTFTRAKLIGKKELKTTSLKLSVLCEKFDIDISAHEALSDIHATITLDDVISKALGESSIIYKPSIDVNTVKTENLLEPAQLHVHSQFSMLSGLPTPEDWIDWCIENNCPGLSITDHNTGIALYRSVRFKEYIKQYNSKHKTDHPLDKVVGIPGIGLNFKIDLKDKDFYMLNAWAVSNEGYYNLMKLSSLGYDNSIDKNKVTIPILTLDVIKENSAGLKFGTAGVDGYICHQIEKGEYSIAEARLNRLMSLFGDSLHLEFIPVDVTHKFTDKIGFKKVSTNSMVTEGNLKKAYNLFLTKMVDEYKIKCVPTTSAFFFDKDDKRIQDCMQKNGHSNGFSYHESYHQRTSTEMYKELKVHLGDWLTVDKYKEWIENTYKILEEAKNIDIKFDFHLPKIDIPKHIQDKEPDYDKQTLLYTIERIRLHGRWNNSDEYKERFQKELDVIYKNEAMNFIPYFLTYEDLGVFARGAGFLQSIARGSAGGSLLCYYLKIIHVDPVKIGLPFERFLSHARIKAGSWPDIDMDISKTARPIIMKYLKKKYKSGFAQISTFSTMKTKNAIKDAAASYGRNRKDIEIDLLCKTIPDSPQGIPEKDFLYGYTDREGERHDGEFDTNEQLRLFFGNNPDIKLMVDKLIGIIRGLSRHASAFVISTIDLSCERSPTMRMWDKHMGAYISVTQYAAKMIESVGLVKADVLGLKTLSAVTDAAKIIKDVTGKDYLEEDDMGLALMYRLPEDEEVYADFYNKETDSSFQFSTPIVKANIQKFAPTMRAHNSALTALLRPGAMDAKMTSIEGCESMSATEYYIDVRCGNRDIEYIHPDLEYILKESNGVFVYQEEIMRFLVEIVGYTLEESDIIRSAIAKKKHDVMMASFDKIREATGKRGWNKSQQDAICNAVMAFSRYSFNKSHSHAYAELGYITMYLKHYHPTEWWTAVLNNEDDEDKLRSYVSLLGDKIKPPSMKDPAALFNNVGRDIVAPISVIKHVGPKSVQELCDKGPFESLEDFCIRINHTKANIGHVGQMVKARAADVFMDNRLPYPHARLKFMIDYKKARGKTVKSLFKKELKELDPLSIFLMEKETNKAFNKTILSDKDIIKHIAKRNIGFIETHKNDSPLMCGNIAVFKNSDVVKKLVDENYERPVAMVLLFEGSSVKKGISKKSGKQYTLMKVELSDGMNEIEAAMWDRDKPLRFSKNSFVYVIGTLTPGWRSDVSITIKEIKQLN